MSETAILKRVRVAASAFGGVLLFRNQVGAGWVGKAVKKGRSVTIRVARWIEFGLMVGSGDTIGSATIVITPEMVGKTIAVFLSVETKVPKTGRLSPEQKTWRTNITDAGGFAIVARSPEEFTDELRNKIESLSK